MVASPVKHNHKDDEKITEDEAALYDRQIRLWGVEAQVRLRNASVAVIGMDGLGAEVAKNTVLAGLKAMTLYDDQFVSAAELRSNFFVRKDQIGQNVGRVEEKISNRAEASLTRCQLLNPNVKMTAVKFETLEDFDVTPFDLVFACGQAGARNQLLNQKCRAANIPFICGAVRGYFGYSFNDFGAKFEFMEEQHESATDAGASTADSDVIIDNTDDVQPAAKKAKNDDAGEKQRVTVQQELKFVDYSSVFTEDWPVKGVTARQKKNLPPAFYIAAALNAISSDVTDDKAMVDAWTDVLKRCHVDESLAKYDVQSIARYAKGAANPVCAIVGGVVSQEIVKAISQFDRPLVNTFVYDALQTSGVVTKLPLGA